MKKLLPINEFILSDRIASLLNILLCFLGINLRDRVARKLFSSVPRDDRGKYTRESNTRDLDIQILFPSKVQPSDSDRKIVERIFSAFCLAKDDQRYQDEVYKPSGLWSGLHRLSYPNFANTNIDEFHSFLSNFGSQRTYTGINWSTTVLDYIKTSKSRQYFENMVIGQKISWWLHYESRGRDLSCLSQPRYGNQCGAIINGNFITYESVLNDFYASMICNFLDKKSRPVIGELGAGYGVLFYFMSNSLSNYCYLDFDLPETLCCATYYLMKSFPEKRFLLYREEDINDEVIRDYDFILMPSFMIEKLSNNSVDIFLNNSSLGEMETQTAKKFVREICRVANSFFHLNHEVNRNEFETGKSSLINKEYPVSDDKFDLITRFPEAINATYKDFFVPGNDIYCYLYRAK